MHLRLALAVWIAAAPLHFAAAQGIAWGRVSNGIRMGLSLTAAGAAGSIVVSFENMGTAPVDIATGVRAGSDPSYRFEYWAVGPSGDRVRVFVTPMSAGGGYMEPVLVRLAAHETYGMLFPLRRFLLADHGRNRPLLTALERGWSLTASLEDLPRTPQDRSFHNVEAWRGPTLLWTGKVESGSLRLPTPGRTGIR